MDQKKRKFLKHLGLLGFGALIALGLAHATSPTETQIIKDYSNAEVKGKRKIVWNDKKEFFNTEMPNKMHSVLEGGEPRVIVAACAHHIDDDGDGIYEKSETVKYCTMPCKDICPVDAITKHEMSDGTFDGKIVPEVDIEQCIGCTKCFQICGYNAIQWINER
jgi:NAD-dependent dihydropyrimidine dehydrogenase PreA subunit